MAEIDEIPINKRKDEEYCTPQDVTAMRGRIGSLLYLTGLTRPYEAYAVSHLAAYVTCAQVKHLKEINKESIPTVKDSILIYLRLNHKSKSK